MPHARLIFGFIASLLLVGCATMDRSECRNADWQIIGIEDGARGRPLAYIGNHRKACAEYGVQPDLEQYRYGHRNGITRFCTADSGFAQGRGGQGYSDVCPSETRGAFQAGYDTGRSLFQLNAEIEQMQRQLRDQQAESTAQQDKLNNIENLLVSGALSSADRQSLLKSFKRQQSRQALLEADIHDLEIGIARKQAEFELLDSNHPYY